MTVARGFGPLTWSRALTGAMLATLLGVAVEIIRSGGLLYGVPRAQAPELNPEDVRPPVAVYLLVLVPAAVAGGVLGAVYFGVWRLLSR
jgi:hypothetical protein